MTVNVPGQLHYLFLSLSDWSSPKNLHQHHCQIDYNNPLGPRGGRNMYHSSELPNHIDKMLLDSALLSMPQNHNQYYLFG